MRISGSDDIFDVLSNDPLSRINIAGILNRSFADFEVAPRISKSQQRKDKKLIKEIMSNVRVVHPGFNLIRKKSEGNFIIDCDNEYHDFGGPKNQADHQLTIPDLPIQSICNYKSIIEYHRIEEGRRCCRCGKEIWFCDTFIPSDQYVQKSWYSTYCVACGIRARNEDVRDTREPISQSLLQLLG